MEIPRSTPDPVNPTSPVIYFGGNVNSYPVSQLPLLPQFTGLHEETGTFMIAPGFRAEFGGTFSTVSGAIAANGISVHGNTGGVINGSIINYSRTPMSLTGSGNLYFNRSGLTRGAGRLRPRDHHALRALRLHRGRPLSQRNEAGPGGR